MTRPFVVGVTGGIGAGKSTVCASFARHGIPTIDTDQVARDVVLPGTEGLAAVCAAFGQAVLAPDGSLDRGALRRHVFGQPDRLAVLEALLHPRIREGVAAQLTRISTPYCLVGIPLLKDRSTNPWLDRILVVDCSEETQLARVQARDGLSAEEVRSIMRAQISRSERLALADDVVVNDGDLAAMDARVDALHVIYLALAAEARAHQRTATG